MSASALLFSSDQRTSAWLSDALKKLGLEVDCSSEIFSCLEKLTSRSFEVVAVDCSEGAEALFLLKTAHDLKQNQAAFSVILADQRNWSAAHRVGASLVLETPIVPEQAVHALLACDEFLLRMKNWTTSVDSQKTSPLASTHAELRSSAAAIAPAETTIFAEESLLVEPLASMPVQNSSLAHRAIKIPSASRTWNLAEDRLFIESAVPGERRPRPKFSLFGTAHSKASTFTRVSVLVFAFLCFGYSLSQPLVASAVFTAATETCAHTLAKAETLFLKANPEAANDNLSVSSGVAKSRPSQTVRRASAGNQSLAHTSSDPGLVGSGFDGLSETTVPSSNDTTLQIPESLQSPLREIATPGPVIARPGLLLERRLGVINLAPEVSQKMLLDKIVPEYPEQARQRGLEGSVVVQAWIAADGSIQALKLIRGSLVLGVAACKAIKQWHYRPYVLNGQAVEAQTFVTIDFKLPEQISRADIHN